VEDDVRGGVPRDDCNYPVPFIRGEKYNLKIPYPSRSAWNRVDKKELGSGLREEGEEILLREEEGGGFVPQEEEGNNSGFPEWRDS